MQRKPELPLKSLIHNEHFRTAPSHVLLKQTIGTFKKPSTTDDLIVCICFCTQLMFHLHNTRWACFHFMCKSLLFRVLLKAGHVQRTKNKQTEMQVHYYSSTAITSFMSLFPSTEECWFRLSCLGSV